jgi:hypothetical protein
VIICLHQESNISATLSQIEDDGVERHEGVVDKFMGENGLYSHRSDRHLPITMTNINPHIKYLTIKPYTTTLFLH